MTAAGRSLPTVTLPAGSRLWRVHPSDSDALWFGPASGEPPRNRFDAPAGEYRVCYLGDSPELSVAETVIRQPHTRLVERAELEARTVSRLPILRGLTLVRFHGPGLIRLGVGADVAHGHPYSRCRALALERWRDAEWVDGIEYRSRWDNDRLCYAIFDRAKDTLGAPDHALSLAEARVINPILRLYEIGLLG